MTNLLDVQNALKSRLANDAYLISQVSGIHEAKPDTEIFPYTVLGKMSSIHYETKTCINEQIEQELHIWSSLKEKAQVIEIMQSIENALIQHLDVSEKQVLKQNIVKREVLEEKNGLYHGILHIQINLN